MGDMTIHISNIDDFICNGSVDHILVPTDYMPDDKLMQYTSEDLRCKAYTYEKNLLDLGIATKMRIINGRIIGDMNGKFTCHKYNGSSVVDYVITDHTTLSLGLDISRHT